MTKKKAITIIASKETYTELSTFNSVEELNETVRTYRDVINASKARSQKKRNALAILEWLKRHSCKFAGVSWKGKRKIAADLGMSDKTVTRICAWLEEIGLIRQYEMKRSSDMRQTSNAIVIQPTQPEMSDKTANKTGETVLPKKQLHNLKQNHNKIRKERANLQQDNITLPIPAHIPADFANLVTSYYRDTKTVFELWGKVRLAYIHSNVDRPLEEVTDIAVNAFRESIAAIKLRRLKKGNSLDSLRGYLYGTTRKMLFDVSTRANGGYYVDNFAEIIS
jgi:hypothetical protein